MREALDSRRGAEPGRGGGCVVPASRGRCELQESGSLGQKPNILTGQYLRLSGEPSHGSRTHRPTSPRGKRVSQKTRPVQTLRDERRSRSRLRTGQHSRDPGPVRSGTSLRPAAIKKLNPDVWTVKQPKFSHALGFGSGQSRHLLHRGGPEHADGPGRTSPPQTGSR